MIWCVDFEWDDTKDRANLKKHGLSFAVAAYVFLDESRTERMDDGADEERWVTVGLVDGEELVVVYTLRDGVARLISARGAEKHEREDYWNGQI